MLTVNGLQLPASFAEFFEEYPYTNWLLKEKVDAYGNPLEAGFEPLDSLERMEQGTAELAPYYGPPDPPVQSWNKEPDFLFDIIDFSKIACFGRTSAGELFCFDFRENSGEPSVIFYDDRYARWRKIAPNFDAFISLFERYEEDDEL